MEAANIPWRPLGELFVARGLITKEELEQALAEQAETGERLGEILVRRNLISSPDLTESLMEQLGEQVSTQEGFGSGLWAEIQRRRSRPESAPQLSVAAEPQTPFGPALSEALEESQPPFGPALGDALEERALDESPEDLEQEIEELRSELVVVAPMPSPPAIDSTAEIRAELEQVRQHLQARTATIESLTSQLETARNDLAACEQTLAVKLEDWAHVNDGADALRRSLSERESRLAQLETELERVRGEREGPIEALQAALAGLEAERDAANDRLAAAETHAAEVERALREARAAGPGPELEQELEAARSRVVEHEGRLAALQARIGAAETALAQEHDAHAQTRQALDQALAEGDRTREALRALEHALAAAGSGRDEARAEVEQVRAALLELEQRVVVHRGELAATATALSEERAAHARARQQSEEASTEADRLRESLREIEREQDSVRAELQQALAAATDFEQVQADLERARVAARELEERLAVAEGRAAELDGRAAELAEQRAALEAELAAERDALQEAENRRGRARRERDAAHAELEQARAELVETEARAATLEQQISASDSALAAERDANASAGRRLEQALAKLRGAEDRAAEVADQTEGLVAEQTALSTEARRELEAAERRRAEVESRLAEEAASHLETRNVLAQALDELTGHRVRASPGVEDAAHAHEGYLCFAPGKEGYRLVQRAGSMPAQGEAHELDGAEYVVMRVGRSPLPFDRRRCVYLHAAS